MPVWGGRGWVGPSSFQALTAAAPPGLGATVTSHPRDILKGASQQGDEFWVGRCRGSANAVLIRPPWGEDTTLISEKLSACDNSRPAFGAPSGIWSIRRSFLQCCGIALYPVSRLVLGERCQMLPVRKRRLCTSRWRASHSAWQTPRTLPRKSYPLRKYSRYLASTSLLRVCLSVADGWVLYVLGQSFGLGSVWATEPENVKGHPTLSPPFSPRLLLLCVTAGLLIW